MKTFSKWIGIMMVLCFIVGFSLSAQADYKPPNYVVLKGGIYAPQTNDLQGFDTGFNGEIGFGHYLYKNWAIEAATGYFKTSAGNWVMYGNSAAQNSIDLKVIPVTLALKGIIPVDRFEFYGTGGMGAYFLETDVTGRPNYYYSPTFTSSHSDVLFGGFLGAGVNYNITPRMFLGVEGRYLWTTKTSGNDADTSLDGFLATLNIGFRF